MDPVAPFTNSGVADVKRAAINLRAADPEKLRAAAQDFEAVLVGQLMGLMLESVPSDGPFGGGNGEDVYKSMLADQMGKQVTKRGGLGLTTSIMNEMIRMQQATPAGGGQ
jgi:peptidoglycan hydrolase FlgJ